MHNVFSSHPWIKLFKKTKTIAEKIQKEHKQVVGIYTLILFDVVVGCVVVVVAVDINVTVVIVVVVAI